MPSLLGQIGISVRNLAVSKAFYTSTLNLGLEQTQEFDTPDFVEIVLAFPRATGKKGSGSGGAMAGAELALMQYKTPAAAGAAGAAGATAESGTGTAKPRDQQGKLLFFVDDVEEVMARCREAAATAAADSAVRIESDVGEGEGVLEYIGIVRDPDGVMVEFVPYMFLQAAQGGSKM